jgi:hypothetical protein
MQLLCCSRNNYLFPILDVWYDIFMVTKHSTVVLNR